jgi:hypothetical protein
MMKRLVTNTLFCFLRPLFLLSSFCILDSNSKIHNEKFGEKFTRLHRCVHFESGKLSDPSKGYAEGGS